MFAFGIFDKHLKKLTLARDAFGMKPLYVKENGKEIIFASEIKSILDFAESEIQVNYKSAYQYLIHNTYDDNSETFLRIFINWNQGILLNLI